MTILAKNFIPGGTVTLQIVVDSDTNLEDLAQHLAEYPTVYRVWHDGQMLAESDPPNISDDYCEYHTEGVGNCTCDDPM